MNYWTAGKHFWQGPKWVKRNYTAHSPQAAQQYSRQQHLGLKDIPMLPERVPCKIVTGCQDAVHQPHTGSPRLCSMHATIYYNLMHPPTYAQLCRPMMCSRSAGKLTAISPYLAVSTCHPLLAKPIYSYLYRNLSAAQLCDRHWTQALDSSPYGGKVATCLDKTPRHHARQAHHGMHTT